MDGLYLRVGVGGGHWEMWGGDLGSDTWRPISGIHVPDK